MTFQNYLVKDGQAVPENPFYYIMGSNVATDYSKFETWKQSHTYATDAKDGCWPVERFEIVWQYKQSVSGSWIDAVMSIATKNYKDFGDYTSFNIERERMVNTRQFAKFKEEVEKPKEKESLIIDKSKKSNAITYQQLLELPWYWGDEDGKQFTHLYKPGYDNIQGNFNYFGTSKQGMRIISVNADYVGHTYVEILGDGGTRKLFNGHVRSFEELKLINLLVF